MDDYKNGEHHCCLSTSQVLMIMMMSHLHSLNLDSPWFRRLEKQFVQLVSDRLTLRENVAEVLRAEDIPDGRTLKAVM